MQTHPPPLEELPVSLSTATWPVNLGAYRRAVTGAPVSIFTAAFLSYAGGIDPATAAAAVLAVASDLGVLLARDGERGLKAHAKTIVSVLSTLLVTVLLALSAYEGADATSIGLGPLLLQMTPADWLAVGLLTVKSLAQAFIPNAEARFDDHALGEHVDISTDALPATSAYIPAQTSAALLGDERTPTTALSVLTPELIAADAAEQFRRPRRATADVPLPVIPASQDFDLPQPSPDVIDLDTAPAHEAPTSSNPLMRTIGGPL